MTEPRLLAIVPARGGSKRLPRKNVRLLGGRPLIAWSVASGLDSGLFDNVLVSTDDQEIAVAARAAGALVPWLRPAELATDTALTSDVLRHALEWYEATHGGVDAVVLLQPTSPLRRITSIQGAVKQFLAQPKDCRRTVVSVSPAPVHPEWCFYVVNGKLEPVIGWERIHARSQSIGTAMQLNGSIYVATAAAIRASQPLVGPDTLAFETDGSEEAIDIDTEDDWRMVEFFLTR